MHSDIYRNFHSMVSYSPYLSRSQSLFYQHHNCRPTLVDLSMTNYRSIKDKKLMLTLSWIYFRYFYGYGYAYVCVRYWIFLRLLIGDDQPELIDDTKHLLMIINTHWWWSTLIHWWYFRKLLNWYQGLHHPRYIELSVIGVEVKVRTLLVIILAILWRYLLYNL